MSIACTGGVDTVTGSAVVVHQWSHTLKCTNHECFCINYNRYCWQNIYKDTCACDLDRCGGAEDIWS